MDDKLSQQISRGLRISDQYLVFFKFLLEKEPGMSLSEHIAAHYGALEFLILTFKTRAGTERFNSVVYLCNTISEEIKALPEKLKQMDKKK